MTLLPIAPDDLPAVVAELRENGVAYYAVEGDIEICGSCHGHDIARSGDVNSPCSSCNGGANDVPPSEWVALAEATCEHQKLREVDVVGAWDDGRSSGCPDCVGGKPKHTLTVDCPHAEGEPECDCQCPTCVSSDDDLWHGTVSVDVVVRAVLPVVDCVGAFASVWDSIPQPAVLFKPNNVYGVGPKLLADNELTPITPLGPDLKPGMFVAVIEASS